MSSIYDAEIVAVDLDERTVRLRIHPGQMTRALPLAMLASLPVELVVPDVAAVPLGEGEGEETRGEWFRMLDEATESKGEP
jgi:hypothetical protein